MSIVMEKREDSASPVSAGPNIRIGRFRGWNRLTEFAEDTAGAVMLLFAVMFVSLFMMIGLAVDYGRYLNARDATITAIDAAVLAAARVLQTGGTQEAAKTAATKYYAAAVTNRLAVTDDTIQFVVVDNGTAIQAKGNAYIKTPIMGLDVRPFWKGVDKLALVKDTVSDQPKAVLAVGGNSEINLEISMMLDVSGSMCNGSNSPCSTGRKLDDMKTAAKDLVSIVVWDDQSKYTSKVAVVPFSSEVRLPTSLQSAMVPTTANQRYRTGSSNYYYAPTPCAAEREGTNRYTDVAATTTVNPISRAYDSVSGSSTTGTCGIATNSVVTPLSSNKTTLTNAINALTAQGGTAGHVGTAWTYYLLSPKWSSLLTGTSKPAAYGQEKHKKIAILMTDGDFNYTFSKLKPTPSGAFFSPIVAVPTGSTGTGSSGGGSSDSTSINSQTSAYQAVQICTQMKASGIEVYTVGFELPNNAAKATMASCATDATHNYDAKNGDELKQAFRDIALKVSSLYLAK
ncbi:MAG: pilus assembly protein TadG-related protein [Hyphomicrobium sp.]